MDPSVLPCHESLDELILACVDVGDKLQGYYNLESDWVIAASVLDHRLNVKFFHENGCTDQ